jgi:dimethylaniline monooxygenase (N-oxide forming)
VCFDARPVIGGGWVYEPDTSAPVHSSIYAGTMLNSCRDTSAYTDFPLDPARYGDFFNHVQFVQYLREYAEHFGLVEHIRLSTSVLDCAAVDDDKWKVRIQPEGAEPEDLLFDAVIAATGHLSKPIIPDFKGLNDFKGRLLHSHAYRTPATFEGKKVAIIGMGSSCVDIASEIAPQAKELHVVSRRGGWVVPRFVLGKPAEAWDSESSSPPPSCR